MNKKGIFFTILAIAFLSLFLVSYSVYSFVQNREGINNRIKTMNSYVSSLEDDIPRKLYISGYRIIFSMQEEILTEGKYIKTVRGNFSEGFFYGNISGKDYTINNGTLKGVTFPDIVKDINRKANMMNINVSFINPKINISQDDPWHVKVTLESNLVIRDRGNLAMWNRTSVFYAYIPIENFEDPIYTLNTYAEAPNKFVKANYSIPINGNITALAENSFYINHTDAPSFLKRLEGDLSADPNGIESLVNTHKLSGLLHEKYGYDVPDKCINDYIYFSANACNNYYTPPAAGGEFWIKIEDSAAHKILYGTT